MPETTARDRSRLRLAAMAEAHIERSATTPWDYEALREIVRNEPLPLRRRSRPLRRQRAAIYEARGCRKTSESLQNQCVSELLRRAFAVGGRLTGVCAIQPRKSAFWPSKASTIFLSVIQLVSPATSRFFIESLTREKRHR